MVICPTMIYGKGSGLHSESIQVPRLISKSRERGAGVHIGRGLNIWSNVFIDEVVDLFILALDRAPSGSFFFAENDGESFLHIASAISRQLAVLLDKPSPPSSLRIGEIPTLRPGGWRSSGQSLRH
jgi:nucleoside-diphosphate-sugar epimerase